MAQQQPELQDLNSYSQALRSRKTDLRTKYKEDPLALAKVMGLRLPEKPAVLMKEAGLYDPDKHGEIVPGLRDLIEDVCSGAIRSAAVIGPRGGGKSFGVSFIEFYLVFVLDYDALNLGGSELQADQVYQYILGYISSNEYWEGLVKGDTTQSKTTTTKNAWIRVLTASQKSVRSPHAGGTKSDGRLAGGVLVIDEEAEADADIVAAALPTINTARPSVNVRSSTFHNVEGSFADLIDDHEEMGYKLYRWDIFDVCEPCECPLAGVCESTEACFRDDHVDKYIDPDTGQEVERLVHRAYCGGRGQFGAGWIPMEEIVTLWRRMKRNHATWEVEAMGQRPSTSGHVIRDHQAWAENKTTATGESLYIPGYPVTICVDWGTANAGIEAWQEQMGDTHKLIHCEQVEGAGQTDIFNVILGLWRHFGQDASEVAADIGGGGNYLNPKLAKEYGIPVRDVNFNEEKEVAVAAWNIYNEANTITLPVEFEQFHSQAKNWKRKNGRIQKGNDHLMDAALCYFSKFVDRLDLKKARIVGVSTSSAISTPRSERSRATAGYAEAGRSGRAPIRAPMARTINRKRR